MRGVRSEGTLPGWLKSPPDWLESLHGWSLLLAGYNLFLAGGSLFHYLLPSSVSPFCRFVLFLFSRIFFPLPSSTTFVASATGVASAIFVASVSAATALNNGMAFVWYHCISSGLPATHGLKQDGLKHAPQEQRQRGRWE